MAGLNQTHTDQTHRIFITSPKPSSDRTGLYILSLLLSLTLILVFYLVYNFISYRRYTRCQKRKLDLEKQFNDHLLIVLNESTSPLSIKHARSNEELTLPSRQMSTTSFIEYQDSTEMKRSISNQYNISNRLVSDL
ncbi:unnamed protein product [Adineta ricciae]|uniref:Uncharacterized protein n=1 Tax=Adineta ricciae TaxID=249248 RepID=A0A813QQ52_ADIRI|nr:unnamed protein product [Adineta ricciae]CAF1685269.1 unnamed protein product [Adineta ricciae]